ncbi:MAG: hypothetical protein H6754_06200 [Candidatus Omnitrophica bacterium]|nr:hypothetical protein [Candidatus Omnitrophota bacterium]
MNTLDMYIFTPLKEMFSTVLSFVPTILCVFIVLFLGYMITKLLHEVLTRLFKQMHIDKVADKLEMSKLFHVGKTKHSISHMIVAVVGIVVSLMFVIVTMGIVGVTTIPDVIGEVVAYISPVLVAVMVLVVGMILAKVVGLTVHMVVAAFGLPNPKLLERISRWAVLLYAAKVALSELGFGFLLSGTVFHIWFTGVVLALALAFGLGGRDIAAKYLAKK